MGDIPGHPFFSYRRRFPHAIDIRLPLLLPCPPNGVPTSAEGKKKLKKVTKYLLLASKLDGKL